MTDEGSRPQVSATESSDFEKAKTQEQSKELLTMSASTSSSAPAPAPASGSSTASDHPQRHMIRKFIQALREQGFLDDNFNNQMNLHENRNSLATFCGDAEPKLDRVEKLLARETVEFDTVSNLMESLKTKAAGVGGKRLSTACADMQDLCTDNNAEPLQEAYRKVTWEYYVLRDCFHHILQAERAIQMSSEE
ncbi:histidine-containing phosphotransfer protein 2-like [Cucurbita moschata]|uniref:Histidine-containing phosphotransfer protein n=1 Tax=Cucurbita moschata TaxID=3662 RepID=A0A6J1EVY2_CUCMO|nr:histidine-containing phosphotransfer protein 2-like [Cucurbita moschata]